MTFPRRLVRSACVLIVALLSIAPVSAQAPAREKPAVNKGLIWKIERNGRTGWLVGSIHSLPSDFYPLPVSMTDAFSQSDMLVEELDINEATNPITAAMMLAKATFPPGTTLSSQLSPETLAKATAALPKFGLDIQVVQQFKPWMVSMMIEALRLQRLGFDPAFGIDKHFQDAAAKAGKQFQALETATEQLSFLDGLSARTQDLMLRESVDGPDEEFTKTINALTGAWRAGDAAALEKLALMDVKQAQEVYDSLIVGRNRQWIPKIDACVQARKCFVVVGAAHMVGPDGLVALMKQKGYSAAQQ